MARSKCGKIASRGERCSSHTAIQEAKPYTPQQQYILALITCPILPGGWHQIDVSRRCTSKALWASPSWVYTCRLISFWLTKGCSLMSFAGGLLLFRDSTVRRIRSPHRASKTTRQQKSGTVRFAVWRIVRRRSKVPVRCCSFERMGMWGLQ